MRKGSHPFGRLRWLGITTKYGYGSRSLKPEDRAALEEFAFGEDVERGRGLRIVFVDGRGRVVRSWCGGGG